VQAPTLVVDFDGTITERDTLDLVVHRFGDPGVRRLTEAQLGRTLRLQDVIALQYGTVRASLPDVVGWLLGEARVRPGLAELVGLARDCDWRMVVVSFGLRELIEPIIERESLDDLEVVANTVEADSGGWRVCFREDRPCAVCGEICKRSAINALRGEGDVVYIGDGYSDGCAAEAADRVFARRRLVAYLEERGLPFEPFEDFFQVADLLVGC